MLKITTTGLAGRYWAPTRHWEKVGNLTHTPHTGSLGHSRLTGIENTRCTGTWVGRWW